MAFEISTTTVAIVAVLLLAFLLRPRTKFPAPLPPSPPGYPLIGQTLTMAKAKWAWRTFDELQIALGRPPVMYLRLGSSDVIVVSTCKAAQDLLEKKSAIYSGESDLGDACEAVLADLGSSRSSSNDRSRRIHIQQPSHVSCSPLFAPELLGDGKSSAEARTSLNLTCSAGSSRLTTTDGALFANSCTRSSTTSLLRPTSRCKTKRLRL